MRTKTDGRRRGQALGWVAAAMMAGLLTANCTTAGPPEAPSAADSAAATGDAAQATLRAGLGTAQVTVLTPTNYSTVGFIPTGTDVTATVQVTDGVVGAGPTDLRLHYFLDGALVAEATAVAPFVFTDLPMGQRHLAVELHDADGVLLGGLGARDGVYVRVQGSCKNALECSDGLSCSAEACVAGL